MARIAADYERIAVLVEQRFRERIADGVEQRLRATTRNVAGHYGGRG